VLVLLGLSTACSRGPSDEELRARATAHAVESRRAAEERQMDTLVGRLSAVRGLEHVLTRLVDTCARPDDGSLLEPNRSPDTLECDMRTEAYFGVRAPMSDLLPRVRAAHVANWGSDATGDEGTSGAAGSVAYALVYQRDQGRYGDGTLMPGPALQAPGARIDWDRPDAPLPNLVAGPVACPAAGSMIYRRCLTSPASASLPAVTAARARYGTVLVLRLGGWDSSADDYFTMPRAD
jgi:hypothetical protein